MDAAPRRPIFAWPTRRPPGLLFASLLIASVGAHLGAAFLFRVTYPAPPAETPRSAQIALALAESALGRSISQTDPAPERESSSVENLLKETTRYHPSFQTPEIVMRPLPDPSPPNTIPTPIKPGPIGLRPETAAPETQHAPARLVVRTATGKDLANRSLKTSANPPPFTPESLAAAKPPEFLLCIAADGQVRFCFLENSSGDRALDLAADIWVRSLQFSAVTEPLFQWGTLRIMPCTEQPAP